MTSTDKNVSESNDSSNVMCVSRKESRKAKSNISSSESNVKRNQNCENKRSANVENDSKEIKLFPIFNLPVKNITANIDKISDYSEPVIRNKGRKCAGSKANIVENDLLLDTPPKQINKATSKKQHLIAKHLRIKAGKKALQCNGHINDVTCVPIINNDLTLVEIESAVTETVEYLCFEVHEDVSDKQLSVNGFDNSLQTNSVEKFTTCEGKFSQVSMNKSSKKLKSKRYKSRKNKSIGCKTSTIMQKDEVSDDSFAKTDSVGLCNTFENNLSQVSKDNSTCKLRLSKKNSGQNKSVSSQTASVQKDNITDDVSLKSNSVEGFTTLKRNLSGVLMDNRTNKLKLNRKKSNKALTTSVQKHEVLENVSSRRHSLRSKGIRDSLINYSEITSPSKVVDKGKHRNQLQNKSEECLKNMCDTVIQESLLDTEVFINHSRTTMHKTKNKSKNAKKDLFSIFSTSKLKSNESKNKSGKRKAKAIEEVDIKSDDTEEINLPSKKKKAVKSSKTSSENLNPVYKSIRNKSKENYKDLIYVTNDNETKSISESSEDSDICVVQDSDSISKSNEESLKESVENNNRKVRSKPKFTEDNVICFPVFSHLNPCNTIFSDTPNKYCINDEISDDIVSPSWKNVIGLIDPDSMQMIKSHVGSFSVRELKKTDKHPVPKSLSVNENNKLLTDSVQKSWIDDENNMLWTDSAQKSVIKEQNNKDTVKEVKSWLLQWKSKFSKKSGSNSESSSDSEDDFIYNGIIISGTPGSGKTSLVFELANELGFTVLEVNASSCRNGRNISHQLKEALESYHVEGVKVENLNKRNIFGDMKESKTAKSKENDKVDLSEMNKTKGIQSFFKAKNIGRQLQDTKPQKEKKTIANFFLVSDKQEEKQDLIFKTKTRTKSSKKEIKTESNKSESFEIINLKTEKSSCKISSLTIILFDDVDIVFEEDEGFWSTVKGFLKISKKPVIFTVGRNLSVVKAILSAGIQIFNMKPASRAVSVTKLKQYCKDYSRVNTSVDLELLTSQNVGDLRRNILNAQFWTQSPETVEKLGSKDDNSDSNSMPLSKVIHVNSFLTGDLNFSANRIRKLLFDSLPNNFSNAILQYHSLGYDILFNNIFNILYNLKTTVWEKLWQNLTFDIQKCDSAAKNCSDSEMWKEACKLFELKKKALKTGTSSKELKIFAEALSDFSYADTFKGPFCNKFQWISASERIRMWTAGLPICSDMSLGGNEDVLNIISLIHIYQLRKLNKATSLQYSEVTDDLQLDLEHPSNHYDQLSSYKTEDDLECVSSVLHPSQLLNRTALILDYLSTIKIMCQNEENRQHNTGKRSGRFLHYFDSISFYIERKTF